MSLLQAFYLAAVTVVCVAGLGCGSSTTDETATAADSRAGIPQFEVDPFGRSRCRTIGF